jgi:hypothetical protein
MLLSLAYQLEILGVDGKIASKTVLKEYDGRV